MLAPASGSPPPVTPADPPPSREQAAFDRAVQEAQQARSAADGKPTSRETDQTPVEVQSGATLSSIAEQHNESLAHIESHNAQISDPDLLHPGQIVFVQTPPAPSGSALEQAQRARSAADGKPIAQHTDQKPVTVEPGDTLSLIALQHNESLPRLEANNAQIRDPNVVAPGQVVFVRGSSATTPPPKGAPRSNFPAHGTPKPGVSTRGGPKSGPPVQRSPTSKHPSTQVPTSVGATVLDRYSEQHNELHQWDALTAGLPSAQRLSEEEALNRPIAAAQYVQQIASHAPGGKLDINKPPSNLTANQKAVIDYVRNTPALRTALDVADKGGKADGTISTDDCNAFVSNATNQVASATNAYQSYLKTHPQADAQSRELVRSAGILAANQSLLEAAPASGAGGQSSSNGTVDAADLSVLAQANAKQSSLSSRLVGAAALWAHPGMLAKLDQAGDDLATTQPDGYYSASNITSWITKEGPSTPDEFRQLITGAAARDLTQNVSTKRLGYDVFVHPERYTGQQKTAVLIQLSNLEIKLRSGKNDWDPFISNNDGIWGDTFMNDPTGYLAGQVQQRASQLSRDPDVTSYLSQNLPGAIHNLVQTDPALAAAAQTYYNSSVRNGAALNTTLLGAKAADIPNDLVNFEQEVGFYNATLGTSTNIRSIVDANPNAKSILQISYIQQIVSGQALQSALDHKAGLAQAISQFSAQSLAYAAALDPGFIGQNAAAARRAFANIVQNNLLTSVTPKELQQAFGGSHGQFDQSEVEQIIQQNQSVLNSVSGTKLSAAQWVSLAQKVYNQAYKGAKLTDTLKSVHEPYAASLTALFAVAALVTPLATGHATTPQTISSGLILTGALAQAGSKALPTATPLTESQAEVLGTAGKTVGGVGSGISGYFTLTSGIQELNAGDAPVGIDSIVQGAAGLVSGGAAVTESVATGLEALDVIGSADAIASFAGPVGWAATGIGLLAASTIEIIDDRQQQDRDTAFLSQVAPVLDQYAFSLPAGTNSSS